MRRDRSCPNRVALGDAIFNVQRVGALMAAFGAGRDELFRDAMQDRLHQPYRAALMGPLDEVFEAAYEAGALGVCISGAGPCILAICRDHPGRVGNAMREVYQSQGIGCRMHVLRIDPRGAHAIDPGSVFGSDAKALAPSSA